MYLNMHVLIHTFLSVGASCRKNKRGNDLGMYMYYVCVCVCVCMYSLMGFVLAGRILLCVYVCYIYSLMRCWVCISWTVSGRGV